MSHNCCENCRLEYEANSIYELSNKEVINDISNYVNKKITRKHINAVMQATKVLEAYKIPIDSEIGETLLSLHTQTFICDELITVYYNYINVNKLCPRIMQIIELDRPDELIWRLDTPTRISTALVILYLRNFSHTLSTAPHIYKDMNYETMSILEDYFLI